MPRAEAGRLDRRRAAALAAALVVAALAAAPAAAWRADRYEREAERLEAQVQRDHTGAVAQARALLPEVDAALEGRAAEDAIDAEQAAAYRRLAAAARSDAATHRERAARWRREARDGRWAPDQGAQFETYAQAAEEEAERELAEAREFERLAAGEEPADADEVERLRAARERLAAVAATPPPPPPPPPATDPDAPRIDDSPPTLGLHQAVGVWRETSDDWRVALVLRDPHMDSSRRLLAYTDERVWEGRYTSFNAGDVRRPQAARMVFTFRPDAEDMDPRIPRWAREAVAGDLTWVAELEEDGTCGSPRLRGRWYPGEVTWEETPEGRPGRAWVSGPGTASRFELASDDEVDLESFGRAALWLRLDASHDPRQHPIQALTKLQTFQVYVTMPMRLADARGPRISVRVEAAGGDTTAIELERQTGPERALATYAFRPVTIADPWEQGVVDVHPSFLSWDSVRGALGSRLDLAVEDGERVTLRYDGAERSLPVYDSWRTRGLARRLEAADRLSEMFARVIRTDVDDAAKREAHDRRRMLANMRGIVENLAEETMTGAALDLIPYRVAGAYVLPETGLATLTPEARREWLGRNVTIAGRAANTLDPLSEEERDGANDPSGLYDGVVWTSRLEREWVTRTVVQARAEARETLHQKLAKASAFALYDGVLGFTGAGDAYTLITQETPYGRPATAEEIVLAAIGITSNLTRRSLTESLLRRVAEPHVGGATMRMGTPRSVPRLRRLGDQPARAPESRPLPRTLPPEQRAALARRSRLVSQADDTEPVPCRRMDPPRSAAPPPRPRAVPDLDTADLGHIRRAYGENAELVDPTGPRLRPEQIGGTCNCAALALAIREATGVDLDDIQIVRILVNHGLVDPKVWNPFERGYFHSAAQALVEIMGAEAASTIKGRRLTPVQMDRWMQKGWRIKDVFVPLDGGGKHAVLIRRFERGDHGGITHVEFFDPALGREVRLPICDFMDVAVPDQQLVFRWGGDVPGD